MTKTQFRLVLVAYLLVLVLSLIVGDLTENMVPEVVREMSPAVTSQSGLFILSLFVYMIVLAAAGIVGIIGLFCFWPPARVIYLVVVLLKVIASPVVLVWLAKTGWDTFFGELEFLFEGVIITLCLVGPAKHLFKPNKGKIEQSA